MGVEINNLTKVEIDQNFLKKLAQKVLKIEKKEGNLSFVFLGQGRMRKLNKKYLGKNRVTDVLAFPALKVPFERFKIGEIKKTKDLGEVVICLREVKKNAKRFTPLEITGTGKKHKESKSLTGFNFSFEKELARVLIHGILHLLGYEHEKSKEGEKKMKEREEYYLKKFKIQN
ncbi:MAG: rRNA maturation RNase YbeY [Patescibacteria group bacterium]|nr:rRNA maturation RNase YbeY [Patescibacteria group bacterium]